MIYGVDAQEYMTYTIYIEAKNAKEALKKASNGESLLMSAPYGDNYFDILHAEEVICSACGSEHIDVYTKNNYKFIKCLDCDHLELID